MVNSADLLVRQGSFLEVGVMKRAWPVQDRGGPPPIGGQPPGKSPDSGRGKTWRQARMNPSLSSGYAKIS